MFAGLIGHSPRFADLWAAGTEGAERLRLDRALR
jgi:hypothetical protein